MNQNAVELLNQTSVLPTLGLFSPFLTPVYATFYALSHHFTPIFDTFCLISQ